MPDGMGYSIEKKSDMNKDNALTIIKNKLHDYRLTPYSTLVKKQQQPQPDTYINGVIGSDDFYQIEIEVEYDDPASGNLRIIGFIDNGNDIKGSYSIILSPHGCVVSEGGNIWLSGGLFVHTTLSLFLLRELPFSRFTFPRWQSVLAITLIGVLIGLDPNHESMSGMVFPLWMTLAMSVLTTWTGFLVIVAVLRWWLKRGGRWDGQGNLFNLAAASWLLADVLGAGLTLLGVPPLLSLPLWLYSIWVGGNALSGAIPRASLSYSMGGIGLSLIPALLAAGVLMGVLGAALALLGYPPPGAGPGGPG